MRNLVILQIIFLFCVQSYEAIGQIDVKLYGAKGDGKNDDTPSIQKAIDEASNRDVEVLFPAGVYKVSTINIKASLRGIGTVRIVRGNFASADHYNFCKAQNQQNLVIQNIIFDANVVASKSSNVRSKGIPLFVVSCKYIEIKNCAFKNSSRSGLRIENSSHIKVNSCSTEGTRGNFGDGYYIAKSNQINFSDSKANDYTRIGFVVEEGSSNIVFENCLASYGHSASKLTGGTEYNAGFWYENSSNITTKNCIARNNTHRGFVASNGKGINTDANFLFESCVSQKCPIGFSFSSKGKTAVFVNAIKCKAYDVDRGFVATARTDRDKFEFNQCEVYMKKLAANAANSIAFMWESPSSTLSKTRVGSKPKFIYSNSKIFYDKNENLSLITNGRVNNGDISTHSGGEVEIVINNVSNSFSNSKLILKSRRGKPSYINK
ncbi:glycosyl hydrolase family 28-related protein [Sphingobacterium griseoflavum]|uniref:Rhamnogalacturonase A/B/Epimerase-like pectate lyase domain-containing protein n=1 Tax=Sphingobacterium griseoflavum TaxID=1474952 RepID=A0ABQ3HVK0_9SPHI|nr:glycosyl hydrolase family 28-related protein [Sphingobacterium griseoflavum]GHE38939.1 hypothetical protein GCM10017764_22640 [Sphingobacterium griseoflavum]